MADEAVVTISVSASKGGASVNSVGASGGASVVLDMTGADMESATQDIGFAADEALAIAGDITTMGLLLVKNMEAAGGNYVQLSLATGGSFAASVFETLKAGQTYLGHPPSTTVYAKANTAAVKVLRLALEGPLDL